MLLIVIRDCRATFQVGGGLTSDIFSVVLYNFQKNGQTLVWPCWTLPPPKKNCPATLEPGLTDCGLQLNVETIIIFSCSSAFHYFLAQILKVNRTRKETTLSSKIETDKCILVQCIGLQTLLRSLQFCVCPRRIEFLQVL